MARSKHTLSRAKILALSLVLVFATSVHAQEASKSILGKIIYLEGKVEVSQEDAWVPVRMNHQLLSDQSIRTPGNGMAEIQWASGSKTVVGPNSQLNVNELAGSQSGEARGRSENLMSNFKRMFQETSNEGRKEEGGIRRSKGEITADSDTNGLYWKQEREISFAEAAEFYNTGEYARAIAALHAFLQQKPDHVQAPMAWVALGHSYIEVNNTVKARQIFDDFLLKYPGNSLSEEVRTMLENL